MSERQYRWDTPHEWLDHHIDRLVGQLNVEALSQDFKQLAAECDADTIQDLFQPDMIMDGYFATLDEKEDEDGEEDEGQDQEE